MYCSRRKYSIGTFCRRRLKNIRDSYTMMVEKLAVALDFANLGDERLGIKKCRIPFKAIELQRSYGLWVMAQVHYRVHSHCEHKFCLPKGKGERKNSYL
jgi:hypothetical protein